MIDKLLSDKKINKIQKILFLTTFQKRAEKVDDESDFFLTACHICAWVGGLACQTGTGLSTEKTN